MKNEKTRKIRKNKKKSHTPYEWYRMLLYVIYTQFQGSMVQIDPVGAIFEYNTTTHTI